MKLTIGVAVYGKLVYTKAFWSVLGACVDKSEIELIVVDNGSADGYGEWLQRYILPRYGSATLITNANNLGVFAAYNQIFRAAKTPIVLYLHNDAFLCKQRWDVDFINAFVNPNIGVVGVAGARGIAPNGGRFDFWSSMLEAEIHGLRSRCGRRVAMVDGYCMAVRRQLLEEVGGFDEAYPGHHFYDLDMCMLSLDKGYQNYLLDLPSHHNTGTTASGVDYDVWAAVKMQVPYGKGDAAIHRASTERFLSKWAEHLPVYA